jgi:hypothetical protein
MQPRGTQKSQLARRYVEKDQPTTRLTGSAVGADQNAEPAGVPDLQATYPDHEVTLAAVHELGQQRPGHGGSTSIQTPRQHNLTSLSQHLHLQLLSHACPHVPLRRHTPRTQ